MAIYHCSTKTVNRSSGRTAVASSAYRSGEKLKDERTGLTHDFTRKDGVAHSEIVSNLDIEIDRSELWNLAEQSENRKDARTAREWVIALPDELDADQRKDLAKDFARSLVGVVSGNGKYSTLRFFNCAQWPKFSTTYLGFASP